MEISPSNLEIDLRWWYWRGYTQQLHAEDYSIPSREVTKHLRHYRDLVEGGGYDAPSAFPSMKPDIDIFGIPGRTRTQRGWYQVKPWPPQPPTGPNWAGHGLTTGATAADIPPELFDLVLNSDALQLGGDTGCTKQELARICLVCRRWAHVTQPRIFERIALRNRADIDTLRAIVFPSPRPVVGAIQHLELSLDVKKYPYHPWIHLFAWSRVLEVVGCYTPTHLAVVLDIEGPLPNKRFMKGIHDLLPNRLPSMSLGITYLQVRNVRFKAFSVLLQLLRELPSVKAVSFTDVGWDCSPQQYIPAPALYYFFRRAQHRSYNVTYTLQRCSDNSAATWLSALLTWGKTERLEQTDADTVCLIGSALVRQIDSEMYPDWYMKSARYIGDDPIEFVAEANQKYLTPFVKVYYSRRQAGERCRVRAISCDHTSHQHLPFAHTINIPDWSLIDTLATSFPIFQAFVVVFKTPADVLFFNDEIAGPKMPRLRASRALRYILELSQPGRVTQWTEATCTDGVVCNIGKPVQGSWNSLL